MNKVKKKIRFEPLVPEISIFNQTISALLLKYWLKIYFITNSIFSVQLMPTPSYSSTICDRYQH